MLQPHERSFANRRAFVALGSNLPSAFGNPKETIALGLQSLEKSGVKILKKSRLFETPCFPAGAGPDYINACAEIEFNLPKVELLSLLHEVEAEFGRNREQRWASRTLDIDLLAIGEVILPDLETHTAWRDLTAEKQQIRAPDELILPHPRLQERAFVLVPLADIAPDWRHPVLNLSVLEMLALIPEADRAEVVPLAAGR